MLQDDEELSDSGALVGYAYYFQFDKQMLCAAVSL